MQEYSEVICEERKIECFYCGSNKLRKYGTYKGTQNFLCKQCGRKFTAKDTYPRMKYEKETIIHALTNYFNGMSTNSISQSFNDLHKININKSTIWRWIIKYSDRVNRFTMTLQPRLSNVWVADETVIDVGGKHYWYWDIVDTKTRFLIATYFSKTRTTQGAIALFRMAKERSKTMPTLILTDKMHAYNPAFNKVFYTRYADNRVVHLTSNGFGSKTNINLIERFHSTIKTRTKVMRSLKKPRTAKIILDGFINHYNFLMEHGSLEGRTPAQESGIDGKIQNWGDLIRLSYKSPVVKRKVVLEGIQ